MTVACVLRSGGDYGPEYVYRLARGVHRQHPDVRFVCLSDVPLSVPRIPLRHDWPRWWPKIEMFRPGLFDGPVLYLDLDTVVWGDLTPLLELAQSGATGVLSDFYTGHKGMLGTGVMLWTGDAMVRAWDAFTAEPERIMHRHAARMDHFLGRFFTDALRIQEHVDGVVSYKAHVRKLGRVPDGTRLVCMHGRPRLHDLAVIDPVHERWVGAQWTGTQDPRHVA